MEKRNSMVIAIALITTFATTVIGTTFAYFAANVTSTGTASQVEVTTAALASAEMALGNTVISTNAYPGHRDVKSLTIKGSCPTGGTCTDITGKITITANIPTAFGTDVSYTLYKVKKSDVISKCTNTLVTANNQYYETHDSCTIPAGATSVMSGNTNGPVTETVTISANTDDQYMLVVDYYNNPSAAQNTQGQSYSVSMAFTAN